MHYTTRLRTFIESDAALALLLVFAFLIRIPGIFYGLPLLLVGDEPSFILGALQMLQSHTIVPATYLEVFKKVLYYPPYIPYVLLLPFLVVIGTASLAWSGAHTLLQAHLLSDLSAFFMVARLLSVLLGTASVFLVYRVAQSLFASRTAAAASAFLLATSLLHQGMSMTMRHWLPVSFIFILILYILTRERIPKYRRLFWAFVAVGVGMGVSTIACIALLPVALWFFFESNLPLQDALRSKLLWFGVGLFVALGAIPTLLYPNSNNALAGAVALHEKTWAHFLLSPLNILLVQAPAEPVLIGLFVLGSALLWRHTKKLFYFFGSFFLLYTFIFYSLTELEHRFSLPLVPFYALVGGFAVSQIIVSVSRARSLAARVGGGLVVGAALCIPLAASVQLALLAAKNDTRTVARDFVLGALTPQDKVIVYGEYMRLPTTQNALTELRTIDPAAVRRTDEADAALQQAGLAPRVPQALNLGIIHNKTFFASLPQYAAAHHYAYVLDEPGFFATSTEAAALRTLTVHAEAVATWQGLGDDFSVAHSSFTGFFPGLFSPHAHLGSTMVLYRLAKTEVVE